MDTMLDTQAEPLPALPVFDGVARSHMAWLSSVGQRHSLRRGDILFERGQPVQALFILLSGHIKLFVQATAGQDKVLEFFKPGDVFGESVLLPNHRWSASAQALFPCKLLALDLGDLATAVERSPAFGLRLLASLSQRVEGHLLDQQSSALRSAVQRVAEYVLKQPKAGNQARLLYHKRAIASRLGLQPETFSRSLKQLVTDGLITVQGSRIVIHNEPALRAVLG